MGLGTTESLLIPYSTLATDVIGFLKLMTMHQSEDQRQYVSEVLMTIPMLLLVVCFSAQVHHPPFLIYDLLETQIL